MILIFQIISSRIFCQGVFLKYTPTIHPKKYSTIMMINWASLTTFHFALQCLDTSYVLHKKLVTASFHLK